MDVDAEFALLRVAQGALANVASHSGAAHVDVVLDFGEESVTLRVSDDGVGFDPATAQGTSGFGIGVMRDRVGAVDGSLSVESRPDHGTTVVARVPRTLQ